MKRQERFSCRNFARPVCRLKEMAVEAVGGELVSGVSRAIFPLRPDFVGRQSGSGSAAFRLRFLGAGDDYLPSAPGGPRAEMAHQFAHT